MLPVLSNSNIAKQTLVLTACYQAIEMVHQIATTGNAKLNAFQQLLAVVFAEDNQDCLNKLSEGVKTFESGIQQFIRQLEMSGHSHLSGVETTRYMMSLITLEKNLSRSNELPAIAQAVSAQKAYYEAKNLNAVIEGLAEIYVKHISILKPRILVKGAQNHLKENNNANRVRASLLIAMRLVILWRSLGGRRWQLFLHRKQYINQAKHLLIKVQ